MELEITPELKSVWEQTLAQLSGASRRVFMASVVKALGRGGAHQAEMSLGWDRTTLRKGLHELNSGVVCVDAVSQRGRKPLELILNRERKRAPNLRPPIGSSLACAPQTQPTT